MRIIDVLRGINPETGIMSKVTSKNIESLQYLGNNIDYIKLKIEEEMVVEESEKSKEWSKTIGWFSGYVYELGGLLKIPFFTFKYGDNLKTYRWNKSYQTATLIDNILDLQAGGSRSGEIDALFVNDDEKITYAFSCKFRHIYDGSITWGETEADRLRIIESKNTIQFLEYTHQYGVVVYDKNHFKNEVEKYKDYEKLDWQDLKIIYKQVYEHLSRFKFDSNEINETIRDGRINFVPRFHQEDGTKKAIEFYQNGGKHFLLDWICRSGKTLGALNIANNLKSRNILLLTNYPSVIDMEWVKRALQKYVQFKHWNIINVSSDAKSIESFNEAECNFVAISLQDLKSKNGEEDYGWDKAKLERFFGVHFDLVICDEVHSAFETYKTQDILENLSYDKLLALSATPFVNYSCGSFDFFSSHHWTMMDETDFIKNNPNHPDAKIYKKYPKLNFFVFNPSEKMLENHKEYKTEEGITFKKLLRVKENGKFFYEKDIRILVECYFGSEGRNSISNYFREHGLNVGFGVLNFLDRKDQCEPLVKLLLENESVNNFYSGNVDYTYSDRYGGNSNRGVDLKNFVEKMCPEKNPKPFVINAVGQLTTGITMPNVDMVNLMNDLSSSAPILQRSFRGRSASDGKDFSVVVDLNPTRLFDVAFEYCSLLANMQNKSHIETFAKFFACVPFIVDGAEVVPTDDKIKQLFEECSKRQCSFRKSSWINEIDEETIELCKDLFFDTKSQKKLKYDNDIEKGKTKKNDEKEVDDVEKNEKEVDVTQETRLKIISLLDNFTWACVFTEGDYNTYEEVLDALQTHKIEQFPNVNCYDIFNDMIFGDNKGNLDMVIVKKIIMKSVNTIALNNQIERFNKNLKKDPNKVIEMLSQNEHFKKVFGEIFTSFKLVDEMLDELPIELWNNPDLKWVDPAMGSANFLIRIKERLMIGLKKVIPDDKKREKHILENMIYGVELQPKNCVLAALRLNPNKHKLNIECVNSLEFDFWKIKFNVVAMNPPYQIPDEGNGASAKPLYYKFIEKAIDEISPDYIISVNPSRWMVGGKGLKDFRKRMIKDKRIRLIKHFPGDREVFKNVSIKGGVNYFLWDKNYDGDCEFVVSDTKTIRTLDKYDIVVQDNNALPILEKVIEKSNKWIGEKCIGRKPFGLATNFKDWKEKGIKCISIGNEENFVDPKVYTDKNNIVEKWKVCTSKGYGSVSRVIGKSFVIEPNSICTETYIVVNVFNTKNEAENFAIYMQTKFFRFMLGLRKLTQDVNTEKFNWVPDLEDYSKVWADEELYERYNLTKKEQNYIENKIKESK